MEKQRDEKNEKYVRKDVHNVEMSKVQDLCIEKHKVVDFRIAALEEATKSINKKIMATLIFTVMTLISIIVAIGTRALA
jgi:deoxyhypusine synthase